MLKSIVDIDAIQVLPAQTVGNISVFPLCRRASNGANYITLDEALSGGAAQVTEVSQGGHVPELRFRNQGDEAVLLLDGEELVGAKQNRVLNLTILAPAHSDIVIPVSCIERGRWAWRSDRFATADRTLYAKARRRKMGQVSESLHMSSERRSDQSDIWGHIDAKAERMQARSDTGAASAMYEKRAVDLEGFVTAIRPQPDQVGAVFMIDDRLAGIELFDSPRTLSKLLPKLLRSYGLDALDDEPSDEERPSSLPSDPKKLLVEILDAHTESHKAVGLGDDIRLTTPRFVGAALVEGNTLVHLSAFAKNYA